MANYLLLDKDRKAINVIEWDGKTEHVMGEGVVSLVQYDGPFFPDGIFDGANVIDPNSTAPGQATSTLADGEAMSVLA
jgi:hypothetical protein